MLTEYSTGLQAKICDVRSSKDANCCSLGAPAATAKSYFVTPEVRQKALLLLLRTRGRMRAEDLATHLGVSERTIYRDVRALDRFGFPLLPLSAVGYELPPGAIVPPFELPLDAGTEAALIGTLAATKESPPYRKVLQTDFIITSAADPEMKTYAWEPKADARGPTLASPTERAYMRVRRAIEQREACTLGGVDAPWFLPGFVLRVHREWIAVGWSVDAQSWQSRPITEIAAATWRPSSATLPPAPDADAWLPPLARGMSRIRVSFPPIIAAIERVQAATAAVGEHESDGGHLLTYDVDPTGVRGMLSRLLRYGDWFRVLEPATMRSTVARAATQIAQRHKR